MNAAGCLGDGDGSSASTYFYGNITVRAYVYKLSVNEHAQKHRLNSTVENFSGPGRVSCLASFPSYGLWYARVVLAQFSSDDGNTPERKTMSLSTNPRTALLPAGDDHISVTY